MTDTNSSVKDLVSQTVGPIAELYVARFFANLKRARGLINSYSLLATQSGAGAEDASGDILRAAVVFMHASLEELLRQVALNLLPHANETILNDIPLAGLAPSSGRAEKFFLGKLKQHDTKSVREVIEESIAQHLEKSNFNSVRDVSNLLRALDLESENVKATYALVSEIMERRHQIVHRADNLTANNAPETRAIDPETVLRWQQGLIDFMTAIAHDVIGSHMFKKGVIESNADGTYTFHAQSSSESGAPSAGVRKK